MEREGIRPRRWRIASRIEKVRYVTLSFLQCVQAPGLKIRNEQLEVKFAGTPREEKRSENAKSKSGTG
jgi:hypothetical protein